MSLITKLSTGSMMTKKIIYILIILTTYNFIFPNNIFQQISIAPNNIDLRFNTDENLDLEMRYIPNNTLLSKSIFLKSSIKFKNILSKNSTYLSEYGAGIFYLPDIYSQTTDFNKNTDIAVALKINQRIILNNFMIKNLSLSPYFLGNLGGLPEESIINGYTCGIFSFAKTGYKLYYFKFLAKKLQLALQLEDYFKTGAYFPLDIFRNTEIKAGLSYDNLKINYAYPLVHQIIRENYPYQGQRIELHYQNKILDIKTSLEIILQETKTSGVINFINPFGLSESKATLSLSNSSISGGLTFYLNPYKTEDQSNVKYYERIREIEKQTEYYQRIYNTHTFDATSLKELANQVDTPEKALEYVYYDINYASDHSDIDGMFTMFTPEEVFTYQRGNCTEQARLQAYLLDQNGYTDLYIAGNIGYKYAHAILFYKDPETGKLKAIDNTYRKIYTLEGDGKDSIAEMYNEIYPGWFSIVVKDKNANGLYQIDSEHKWLIEEWFNN